MGHVLNIPPFQECRSPTIEKSHHDFLLKSIERKKLKNIHEKDTKLHNTLQQCYLRSYILV